jgi:obg-like ATPase 1
MRAFDDPDVIHVEDRVDPIADIEIITNELRLKDLEAVEKNVAEVKKLIPRGLKKEQKEELASAEKVRDWLAQGKDVRNGMELWDAKDVDFLNERQLLSAKPVVYLVNLSPEDYGRKKNKWLGKIAEWVAAHGGGKIIPFSGKLESDFVDMPADEAAKLAEGEQKLESALPKIIKTGFAAIHLIYYFTAGADEVRCWTLRRGMKAPQAAGVIHTDFEKGFVCGEIMAFEELREAGSEAELKAKGRYRQEGKTYVMQDGDIAFWKAGRT